MRARREASHKPAVALAGYTNAGKSTLLNALTGAGVGVGSRLFHTLDPTTRGYEHNGRSYLVTDTVGFIRKLPHQLVEAFKATLEETRLADLIVQVVDGSETAPERERAIAAVDSVLAEIDAREQPRLLVYNKIDLLDPGRAPRPARRGARRDRRLGRHRRGGRRAARSDRARLRGEPARGRAAAALLRGRPPLRAATSSPATSTAPSSPRASASGR